MSMLSSNDLPESHEAGYDPFLPQLREARQLCRDVKTTRRGGDRYFPSESRIGDVLFNLQRTVLQNLTRITRDQFIKIMDLLEDLLSGLDPLQLKTHSSMLESIGFFLEELSSRDDRPDLIALQLRIGNWRTVLRSRANLDALLN